jgi:hypothetical protein
MSDGLIVPTSSFDRLTLARCLRLIGFLDVHYDSGHLVKMRKTPDWTLAIPRACEARGYDLATTLVVVVGRKQDNVHNLTRKELPWAALFELHDEKSPPSFVEFGAKVGSKVVPHPNLEKYEEPVFGCIDGNPVPTTLFTEKNLLRFKAADTKDFIPVPHSS